MRIFDCFLFFRELELLELRLHTHTWADAFVAVESPRTFSNLPKGIVLDKGLPQFRPFAKRLRHVVADDLPWPEASGGRLGKKARMALNGEQWERVRRGLPDAKPNDIIVLSDLDEIIRPEAMERAVAAIRGGEAVRFGLTLYFYHLNGFRARKWYGPVANLAKRLLGRGQSLWEYRQGHRNDHSMHAVTEAGWHFSYLGGTERVRDKLASAAHPEYDRFLDDPVGLAKWIAEGHPFAPNNDAAGSVKPVALDETFPPYLLANRGRFKHLIRGDA